MTAVLDRVLDLTAIRAEKARRSLRLFVEQAWPIVEPDQPFVANWHIDALCAHLEAVSRGEIMKLLVNVPPGTMKSYVISVFWPAWEWATTPGLRYLTASYSDSLTIRDNLRVRKIVQSDWYRQFYRVQLSGDQNQKIQFDTMAGGWRIATSIGGRGTGQHPDRIIIDDPHSAAQAASDAERTTALDWFDQTISTRGKSRGARLVVIMQRLHERDLTGHILERGDAAEWTHLCLPMRYEPGRMAPTPLGWTDPRTEPGALLWPAMFPEPSVRSLELGLGSYGTAGQLQQRPAPASGGLFKREDFGLVSAVPAGAEWCRSWDKAGSDGQGDWTAGVLMAKVGGLFYVADVIRRQLSSQSRNALIKQTASVDAHTVGRSVKIRLEQEPGSGGKESAEISVRELAGYDVQAKPSTGDKVTRARPFAAQVEASNVRLVSGPWVRDYLDELAMFPNGRHDDQVDASSGAFNTLALGHGMRMVPVMGW